jgi:tetratricopeptide (TPR) repeat protein
MNTKLSIFAHRIIEAGWLAAAVSVPLFFNIYSARTFEPDKITLLRSIVTVMVLAWLILVIEQGRHDEPNSAPGLGGLWQKWRNLPLFLPTLILVLVYLASTIFSLSPKVSLWGSYQRMQGTYSFISYIVVFAMVAGYLRTREQADRLVTIIILTSIPVSLYGIVQHYGLDPLPWAGDVTRRVASNMGNAIFVASYLIMIVPLTLSRLIESMTAIIREEEASWGHTILAAIYIFVMAIQIITIIFSRSRGPMLGILTGFLVMGLLILFMLRRYSDSRNLSPAEIATGLAFVVPLGLAGGLGGGLGYAIGLGVEKLLVGLNYPVEMVSLLGAALGGALGFFGLYVFMALSEKGWRWLWLSWLGIAGLGVGFLLLLNLSGTSLDPYLNPVRELPGMDRLSSITITEGGTGKVRVLIWDAAIELVKPHEPLGITGDNVAPPDSVNFIRPLLGYGPESMFNAFAFVYPPELAHVEKRGSSADRSHNETIDSLVITGGLGFLAFYFLMTSLFYHVLKWLGWAAEDSSRRRLTIILLLSGLLGIIIPILVDNDGPRFTFVALGLPFGLVIGMILHMIWQGIIQQPPDDQHVALSTHPLLLIGLLGAVIGHFIEVHFVFSIAATYTYFWIYAGLLVALSRIKPDAASATETEATIATADNPVLEPEESRRIPKGRSRRRSRKKTLPVAGRMLSSPVAATAEGLDTWISSQGLAMAIILMILTFDFITPRFQFSWADKDSMSLLWMLMITWLVGLAIALSDVAIRRDTWGKPVNWWRAGLLYALTSLGYAFFYSMFHRMQFGGQITVTSLEDVIAAANIFANGLLVFYLMLFVLMLYMALLLGWNQARRLRFWRADIFNYVLYLVLLGAGFSIIGFKNLNVVKADVLLKEGERYRNGRQWNEAIALHQKAISLDPDEDFYYLMLALDYQLMAQDNRLEQAQQQFAWEQGEQTALKARRINAYNPDNTGNMGRYYFTLGQVFSPERFVDALTYFEKAAILAPSNVIYHNLWAQAHYIMQNYQQAVDRLEISLSIDSRYPPTWQLLGDTYAAIGNVDEALKAHSEAMQLNVSGSDGFAVFADQFFDQRLNFYISAGKLESLINALQQLAVDRPGEPRIQWAIGHAYNVAGQPDKGIAYLTEAITLGDTSEQVTRELANIHLSRQEFDQAQSLYQRLLQNRPDDIESHSALAYIYAQQGRLDEAIQENQMVLEQSPNDYDSLKNLAILHQQQGQWQPALDAARQAQQAAPEADQPSWEQFIAGLENQLSSN